MRYDYKMNMNNNYNSYKIPCAKLHIMNCTTKPDNNQPK